MFLKGFLPIKLSSCSELNHECDKSGNVGPYPYGSNQNFGRMHKFKEDWIGEFTWIIYEDGIAKCQICMEAKDKSHSSSKFTEGFSRPFKHETFKYHDDSARHKKNVEIVGK